MSEDVLLEKIGNLIDHKLEPLKEGQKRIETEQEEQGKDLKYLRAEQMRQINDIKELKGDVKTLDMKLAIIHKDNKKEHSQIMDMLFDSNEINYKVVKEELKKLEERIEHLEKQQHISKN